MDPSLAWRAAGLQLVCVALLFAVLVALPLPGDFFRDHGPLVGPVSWLACALLTGRLLALALRDALVIALASGLAAALVGVVSHSAGVLVGVLAFGAVAGVRGRRQGGGRTASVAAG